jgi:hypothetical protein
MLGGSGSLDEKTNQFSLFILGKKKFISKLIIFFPPSTVNQFKTHTHIPSFCLAGQALIRAASVVAEKLVDLVPHVCGLNPRAFQAVLF